MKDQVEDVREDQYLEDLYGMKSYMDTEDWMKKMVEDGKWVFDSAQLRKRLLEAAEIE